MYAKRKYRNVFNVFKLIEIDCMKFENFKKEDIGIFVVGNERDFAVFTRFYNCFKNRIIICTENDKISKKYKHLISQKYLDISKPKIFYANELTQKIEALLE